MLNSRPSENMSRMTPSSASVWMSCVSAKSGNGGVRPDDHAGEQIAEHDRLAQSLEDDGRDRRDAQHQRERAQENVGVVHAAALACGPQRGDSCRRRAAIACGAKISPRTVHAKHVERARAIGWRDLERPLPAVARQMRSIAGAWHCARRRGSDRGCACRRRSSTPVCTSTPHGRTARDRVGDVVGRQAAGEDHRRAHARRRSRG